MDQPSPSICGLHPGIAVTGFCSACLRERLAGLHPPSSSACHPDNSELRRCKSFSYGRSAAAYFEPQRRSCDARGALFHQEPPCLPDPGKEEEARQIGAAGRPMKEHINQESSTKIAASFGGLGKKWQEWRRKNKLKKQGPTTSRAAAAAMPPEKPRHRSFRDSQSEVAVDALGRRSLDVSTRLSLDAGRISVDGPKYSLGDEPRASWDGYHGSRPVLARLPAMVEDVPVPRFDGQIPVEEEDDDAEPGGSTQTRDYYLDSSSSSRRRRSLDRSSVSSRKSFSDASELPRMIAGANANARVSPAISAEFYHYHHAQSVVDHHPQWEQLQGANFLRDDISESFESAFRDHAKGVPAKKSKKWIKGWNIWGLIHKKSSTKESEAASVADRSFSESWPELRARGYNGQMLRCNSSVSARSSLIGSGAALGVSGRRSNVETHVNGTLGRMRKDEVLLERNLSARYAPCGVDNGMIQPHLNPMVGSQFSRRNQNGVSGKGRPARSSNPLPRSTLGLY